MKAGFCKMKITKEIKLENPKRCERDICNDCLKFLKHSFVNCMGCPVQRLKMVYRKKFKGQIIRFKLIKENGE